MTIEIKEKQKKVISKQISPKGELVGFNAITKPSVTFNPDGVYNANILISKTDGEAIIKEALAVRKEQYKTFGKGTTAQDFTRCKPYVVIEKNEDGEIVKETPDVQGRYILKTDMKATIKCKNGEVIDIKIPVFDAHLKAVKDIKLGEGSEVRLAFNLEGYSVASKTGVGAKLKSVQVINLVEYAGGGSAESYGFGEEDGFTDEDKEVTEDTEDDSEEEQDF